jgi:hypothetical protein
MHLEFISSAGMLPINTVGAPGTHGAGVTGVQGSGVKTPNFAAVAAATTGLAMLLHMLNGKIFTNGLLSMMLAMGSDCKTRLTGKTMSEDGATPNEHCIIAPILTSVAMVLLSSYFRYLGGLEPARM